MMQTEQVASACLNLDGIVHAGMHVASSGCARPRRLERVLHPGNVYAFGAEQGVHMLGHADASHLYSFLPVRCQQQRGRRQPV
jgi:hypothetical protein